MAMKLYTERYVQAIANAIRSKNGKTEKYKIGEMSSAIIDLMSYLSHIKQASAWFMHSLIDGYSTRPPSFDLDDYEAGYMVFDAIGHYVVPALISKHPKIYLKITAVDGAWKIFPVLYVDPVSGGSGGMCGNNSNIGVYPMTHLNTMPYMTDENYPGLNYGEFGDGRNLSTTYDDSIFSKGSTYIWNVDTSGTHPAVLEKLDGTNSGVISFADFSRDFLFTDLIDIPDYLDGEIENVVVYRSNNIVNWPSETHGTYFGVFFHTGEEKVYYDTNAGQLKSAGTMKSYTAPSVYGSYPADIMKFNSDQKVAMYFGKLDVSSTDLATVFGVSVAQADVADVIPFRTYDIEDQNGNIIAAKNCDVEDFGIEPKGEA